MRNRIRVEVCVRRLRRLSLALALAGTAACGGSGSGVGSASGSFLMGDAAVDGLLSFSAVVDELHLEEVGGGSSANLLGASVELEFLGLTSKRAWIAEGAIPAGTYDAVRVVFQPGTFDARRKDGSAVGILASSDVLVVALVPPLVVTDGGYHRVDIDLDLFDSLDGDVDSPPLDFDPDGDCVYDDGSSPLEVDELEGIVSSVDPLGGRFTMDAFVDDDLLSALGAVVVVLDPATLLVDQMGLAVVSQADYLASLQPGATLVEVHGSLGANSTVNAKKVEVEDHSGGSLSSGLVRIEGLVIDVTPGVSFDLLIEEIEKNGDLAESVLAGLTDPSTISCSVDASTLYFIDSSQVATGTGLLVGHEVDVRFSDFSAPPFPVSKVEIESDAVEYEGVITDVSLAPASIVIQIDPDHPCIGAGQVDSALTDITVELSGSSISLDAGEEPSVLASQLVVGLEVEIEGVLSGLSSAPSLSASAMEVEPGRFEGIVVSSDALTSTFATDVGALDDPFGDTVTGGPFLVHIDPSCKFDFDGQGDGSVATESDFHALFAGLGPTSNLEIKVEGIGNGVPNEVLAFSVEMKVSSASGS